MLWCCVCVWWAFLHTKTTRQIKLSAQKERGNIVFIEEKRILLVASSNVNVDEIEFRQQTLKRKMNEYVNDGWMHRCTETKNKTSFVIFFQFILRQSEQRWQQIYFVMTGSCINDIRVSTRNYMATINLNHITIVFVAHWMPRHLRTRTKSRISTSIKAQSIYMYTDFNRLICWYKS